MGECGQSRQTERRLVVDVRLLRSEVEIVRSCWA